MSSVAVTGSSGRIGRAIQFELAKTQHVIGIDLAPSSATTVVADIGDFDALRRAFEGTSTVIHAAALHAPHVGIASDQDFHRINVEGTDNAVRAARDVGVGRFVLTSTTALYGYASQLDDRAAWIDESTVPQPKTIYHRTKLESERLVQEASDLDFQVRVIRMSRCFPEPAPSMAAYRLHRGIDVRDVATAHIAAATNASERVFATYVVSGRTPFERTDAQDLKRNAAEVIRRRTPQLATEFESRGWKLPSSIDRVYSSEAASRELDWVPRYGPEEVLAQLDRDCFEVLPPQVN